MSVVDGKLSVVVDLSSSINTQLVSLSCNSQLAGVFLSAF